MGGGELSLRAVMLFGVWEYLIKATSHFLTKKYQEYMFSKLKLNEINHFYCPVETQL